MINGVNVGNLLDSLSIMWKGMLSIFIVVGILILITVGLNKLDAKKKKGAAKSEGEE